MFSSFVAFEESTPTKTQTTEKDFKSLLAYLHEKNSAELPRFSLGRNELTGKFNDVEHFPTIRLKNSTR